jgi:hypothetical protein
MKKHKKIDPKKLIEYADRYIDFCLESKKEVATNAGIWQVKDRHLPTISYFLLIWLPRQKFEFYERTNYYNVLNNKDHPLHEAVSQIDEMFRALAADVVANEGKGIFYAKNLLGWTDRAKNEEKHEIVITYEDDIKPK